MIRKWNLFHKSAKFRLRIECPASDSGCARQTALNSTFLYVNRKSFSSEGSVVKIHRTNMSFVKLTDYDCIGFDLDHTLLRYNVTNMVHLIYEILAKYLVTERGYSPKYLLRPLQDKDLDFMQKGLFLDTERGNIIRISSDGTIHRACHGSKLLSTEAIREIYPEQRWEVIDSFCKDMLSTWNGPSSMKVRSLLDYFDIPVSVIFARVVDTLDEDYGERLKVYNVWPDILDGLIDMYSREQFSSDKGSFFPSLRKHPEKYLYKCDPKTISWLREVKKNRITFLITGSNVDFADFTASYALGKDWRSLFDIVIGYAKKPGFFTADRPFLEVVGHVETDAVKDLKRGEIYSHGNWKGLVQFFEHVLNKSNPSCIYIGDNLLQDVYVPNAYVHCDTVAVIEEQMSEGMVHQGLSHPDEKILNSTLWGSYFCLKDSTINTDSFWGHIIKKYAVLCIPEISLIAQNPLEKSYLSFNRSDGDHSGYYPAMPLSISNL